MSFLAPLYFLGAMAVAGPIVFHLIRRQPKGEVEFSSLMFLESTPPRLTRRSRLENLPLLLLRCAAICMLAFAFARPFLPMAQSDSVEGVKQAIVLLVDQSASMQRTDLWEQANQKVKNVLDSVDSDTLISVIGFDSQPRTVLSLQESAGMAADVRAGAVREAVSSLSPTWQSTDLGQAIRYAADQATLLELGDAENADENLALEGNASAALETRIILLSDLQSGAKIQTLQGYEWPDRVWLDVQPVTPRTRGNVSLQVLPQAISAEQANGKKIENRDAVRVQVSQSDDGDSSTFRLRFDGQGEDADVIQVPAGQSRFFWVDLPPVADPTEGPVETATLQVLGDQDDFDNSFHFVRPRRISQRVLFVDSKSTQDDRSAAARESLSFFAKQLPWSDSTRDIEMVIPNDNGWSEDLDPLTTPLLIFDASPSIVQHADQIEKFLQIGGRALIVLDKPIDEPTRDAISRLLNVSDLQINEADESDFRLIASVDFESAVIAPLAQPGVNDFSNIRVWKHRRIDGIGDDINRTLKLDDGSPLLVRRDVPGGDTETSGGKLWVLTTGWQPNQSQFALSSKFVPILLGMLGPNSQIAPASLVVGDSIDDSSDQVAAEPGIVGLDDGTQVAINLDPVESQTTPIDADRLAEFGAVVSSIESRDQDQIAERALRDVELESRQGWWQWLILATLGLIAAETLLAAKNAPGHETTQ